MDRLPKRFEDEILRKNCVKWNGRYYSDTVKDVYITRYHIAAIGLEAIRGGIDRIDEMINGELQEKWWLRGRWEHPEARKNFTDKSFCTCIFKAIREIYD